MIKKYRKLPIEIEAIQYTRTNSKAVKDFIARDIGKEDCGRVFDVLEFSNFSDDDNMSIYTLEGSMHVTKGDYIIRGIEGEFYPCKEAIFLHSYEVI